VPGAEAGRVAPLESAGRGFIYRQPRRQKLSDDRSEPVDLAYIGRALRRLTSDVASLRDDMHVLTAIVLRHDREFERLNTKLDDMLRQLRTMVAQHQRTAERVRQLEDQR
jgi:predicted RNase H-like nuclease (RuvC/YqgF family)